MTTNAFECAFTEQTFMEELCCWLKIRKQMLSSKTWKYNKGDPQTTYEYSGLGDQPPKKLQENAPGKACLCPLRLGSSQTPVDSVLPQSILSGYSLLLLHAPLSPSVD